MIDKELLAAEVAKKGFSLEVRVVEVFRLAGFEAKQNFSVSDLPSIDVVASKGDQVAIIQCKGHSPDGCLVLQGNTSETMWGEYINKGRSHTPDLRNAEEIYGRLDALIYSDQGIAYINECHDGFANKPLLIGNSPRVMRHCYNGDFHQGKDKGHKLASPNDANNNFYKACAQLVRDVNNISKSHTLSNFIIHKTMVLRVFPIIVTNCPIYVKENDEVELKEVSWSVLLSLTLHSPGANLRGIS